MPLELYNAKGTIVAADDFDAAADADTLRGAMKGLGTDEQNIIDVLAWRTNAQRQEIKDKYQASFGRDLVDDLKEELGGEMEDAILALMTPLDQYLATEIHEAIDGIGTNEKCLVEVLCARNNASINAIKCSFEEQFEDSLVSKIQSDTAGPFERLLVSLAAACRDEDTVDGKLAKEQAQQLVDAGEAMLGTDESVFNKIFATCSHFQLLHVFHEYEKLKDTSLEEALKSELTGSTQDGYLAVYQSMKNMPGFFATRLHDALAGAGTEDRTLIRILVSRSEIDLANIKEEYETTFERSLSDHIDSDTGGKYKKLLLDIVAEC